MNGKFIVLFALFIILSCCKNQNNRFLADYMNENNLTGTVVIESLKNNKKYVYNEERSKVRFLPASTFKIINTLIALQAGAVKDQYEIIEWDGKDKGFSEWNKDHCINTAFKVSCVWFYQELAKRIGNDIYLYYLDEINYGNEKTGQSVDTFWLNGDLRISAVEQVEVMKNIYFEKYSFDKNNYEILKDVMITDQTGDYIIRSKTGWVTRVEPHTGWYTGYIETGDDIYFFSCNIEIKDKTYAVFREKIIYRALYELGIIDKKYKK